MSREAKRLFHSMLSFALNAKTLSPREVVGRVESAWRSGGVPVPAAERVYQADTTVGASTYAACIRAQMPAVRNPTIFWDAAADLPEWFWTGKTHMACTRQPPSPSPWKWPMHTTYSGYMVIRQLRLRWPACIPTALRAWYLGIYIDAF